MKTKTSKLIILMIALFTVMLIGTTKVDATTTDIGEIIKLIPDTITLDITEIEYPKANELVIKNIAETLKSKGIDTDKVDLQVHTGDLYLGIEEFHKGSITITNKENNVSKSKDIKLEYNRSKYNSADEQYIKNLKIEKPEYFEYNFNKSNNTKDPVEAYYANKLKDKTLTLICEAGAGQGSPSGYMWTGGTALAIFKNGILYNVVDLGSVSSIPVITVPSTVAEDKISEYVINLIKPYYKEEEEMEGTITLVKGTETLRVNVTDGYTVNYEGKAESYIIIRQEEKPTTNTSAVTKTDSTTNVKLNAPVGTVPSNTVLEVKALKEGTTYNTVKKALETMKNFTAFDITLKSNGVTVQPNGNVKISVPIPEGYNKENLKVYRVEDNGNKTEYKVTVEGNYATFETDHFSTYVLAETKTTETTTPPTTTTQPTNKGEKDNTPKTGTVESITYIIPVVIISALGVVAFRKKETK